MSVVSDSVRPCRRQPTRLPRPWDSPGKNTGVVAISFSSAWKWKVKVKSLSCVWLLATPWTVAYQAPPSMGFSRQEYWGGVPLPSPWLHDYSRPKKTIIFKIHYLWLCWVSVAVCGLSLVVEGRDYILCCCVQALHSGGFSYCRAWALGSQASVVVVPRL